MKDTEEKLKVLDALVTNSTMEELLQTLEHKFQAIKLASGPESTSSSNLLTFSQKTCNVRFRCSPRPSESARCGAEPAYQRFECPAINKVCNSCKLKGHYENHCRNTEQSGRRKKERKNVNHASDTTDEQTGYQNQQ